MKLYLNPNSVDDYCTFLKVKAMPRYKIVGRIAEFPDEYSSMLGLSPEHVKSGKYKPISGLFDYQRAIAKLAIIKRKFAVFAECGMGKTCILTEFARHAADSLPPEKCVLIVSPLMVVKQTLAEVQKFYGDSLPIEYISAKRLSSWLKKRDGSRIGITNYEALREDTPQGRLGSLIVDESSYFKSHYGHWGTTCVRLGKGLRWKLALTGTPAPNDRIEYALHAVFLDAFPTVNAFLARFFVNRGHTDNRWELKPHALKPFYTALSHWSIFLTNPATYGWQDNVENIPPINVHIHNVPLTQQQQDLVYKKTGMFFLTKIGGIASRTVISQIAKGNYKGKDVDTNKPAYIRQLIDSWPEESTIIWCLYNREQEMLEKTFPDAASITGSTPPAERERLIDDFKAGRRKVLISKGKILGFGLNLQIATRQIFSGLQDSYESYHQCVKRSNRIGSTRPLNVHIPITDIERPMINTVLRKAKRVQSDTEIQERLFKEHGYGLGNDS